MLQQTKRKAKTSDSASAASRPVRSDGLETRNHILQIAGRLYAQKGFARTTSREICVAAGTDLAAVNYHFGNKNNLYDAVLVEAHAQLIKLDDLEAIAQSMDSPESKLSEVIGLFIGRSRTSLPWGLHVLVHELLVAPSPHISTLMRKAVLPKAQLVMGIVAQILGVPVDHPAVQRAVVFVVLPCIAIVIAPQDALKHIAPLVASDRQMLVEDMTNYALAGLKSISAQHRLDTAPGKKKRVSR